MKGQGMTKRKTLGLDRVTAFFRGIDRDEQRSKEEFEAVYKAYKQMDEEEKQRLFEFLLTELEVKKGDIQPILERLLKADENAPDWYELLSSLRDISLGQRFKKFSRLAKWPGGLKFLLDLRGDLLALKVGDGKDLSPLDKEISLLFDTWFQEGFLYLEEITLDSPYRQIEIIKSRDLVHPMSNIEEMGQRLGKDRRCFALYHKVWPLEPIVFIEVALTEGIATRLEQVMTIGEGETRPDTAMFYSINNTQNGLAGLGLGKVLIFKVVEFIHEKEPNIKNFATLSPLPGFYSKYLRPVLLGEAKGFKLSSHNIGDFFSKSDVKRLLSRFSQGPDTQGELSKVLVNVLDSENWFEDQELANILRDPLVSIAYHYITQEKTPEGKPINPVANFHMENGATVSKKNVNFLANTRPRAIKDSLGFMVNYMYSYSWLTSIKKAVRWLDRIEVRGLVRRWL